MRPPSVRLEGGPGAPPGRGGPGGGPPRMMQACGDGAGGGGGAFSTKVHSNRRPYVSKPKPIQLDGDSFCLLPWF